MAGKRHHTIPRFLLKSFASSHRGDEVNVWMYRKGGPGIQLNIRNVGVEKEFYGKAGESDLDERITAMETDFACLVDALRSSSVPEGRPLSDGRIPRLIGHLSLRTRQLRQSALEITETMLQGLRNQLSRKEVVQAVLKRELTRKRDLRERIKAQMVEDGMSPHQITALMKDLETHLPAVIYHIMPLFLPQFTVILDEFVSLSRSVLPNALKAAFIDAMSRNLNLEQRTENYAKYIWFVASSPVPILLGDTACLFEVTGKRRFKPLDDSGDDVMRTYLPLAPDRVLIGTLCSVQPWIDFNLLNKAIARCSHEFIVSSRVLPPDSALIKDIGKWSGLLGEKEIQALIDDLARNFLKD